MVQFNILDDYEQEGLFYIEVLQNDNIIHEEYGFISNEEAEQWIIENEQKFFN